MSRSVRISVMVVLLLSLIPAGTVLAKSPNDVDDLRGRWEFVAFYITPEGDSLPFDIFINDLAPDPNGETGNEYLAVGWMASPGVDALAPMSLSATHLGDGVYDLSLLSTVIPPADLGEPFVIQFLGTVTTNGKGVPDDVAGGTYRTGFKEGDWSGSHHDRRRTKCPAVGDIPVAGLYFLGDVYVGHNFFRGQLTGSFTQLEGFTNIVSTGMLVQWPGGSTRVIPFFTDIFSPQADFISQIRYLDSDPGDADTSGPYTFTLLDALGDPIPGTTQTDFWTACTQGMSVTLFLNENVQTEQVSIQFEAISCN